ncbi:hypothetical protein HYX16_06500 [Candidatus Woesearchaeota archaeon]|nr:hypothetical protein [Candidatus Woesearchaeota archaeon]
MGSADIHKKLNLAFILSNIVLLIYLAFRLINQAKILEHFPLDTTNDISSHMAQLFFLKVCDFQSLCPYWYNGHYLLKFYPPGWFFFSYPLLLLFKRPEIATYLSILIMLLISFMAIYKIIKLKEKSLLKSLTFFLFLFATPTSVSAFFRLGRVTEMFAWTIFLILAYLILKYKDKKFDAGFLWFVPFYAILLISQPVVAIPFHFFLLSMFLAKLKSKKELLILIVSVFLGIILSSFWWYPFVKDLGTGSTTYNFLPDITERYFDLHGQWTSSTILITILPMITIFMFFIYYYSRNKDKRELFFYSPILLASFLVFTRISTLIPYINFVYPEPYFTFFLIFSLIFFFNTDLNKLPIKLKNILPILIFLTVIGSIIASFYITSYYPNYTDLEKNTLEILNKAEGKFVVLESPSDTSYAKAYYSYAAIYLNLSTPSGWSTSELTEEYGNLLKLVGNGFRDKNCKQFKENARKIGLKEVITYGEYCQLKERCNLNEKASKGNVCLLKL